MLNLVAAAFEDGWAFVRHAGKVLLVKPPYRDGDLDLDEVRGELIESAVTKHGFQMVEREFEDWTELIEFLRSELTKIRQYRTERISDADLVAELLKDAPLEVFIEFLQRAGSDGIGCKDATRFNTTLQPPRLQHKAFNRDLGAAECSLAAKMKPHL
ncbi:MAG: hypothetical protein JNL98_04095 [Bryobacterales bacterium]|nr:hypothetical protein [Bryobacterales bacterium]